MINDIDKQEIVDAVCSTLATRMAHRSVDMTDEDRQEVLNFLDQIVSNYVDNTHLLNNQHRLS